MLCPKCAHAMSAISATYGARVERCDHCHGILCSDAALSQLHRQWFFWPKSDTAGFDTGAAADGRRWNRIQDVACPACGKAMSVVGAPGQQHIELERCNGCGLTFFDAGEMTDLRYKTFADWVRDRLHALKPGAAS